MEPRAAPRSKRELKRGALDVSMGPVRVAPAISILTLAACRQVPVEQPVRPAPPASSTSSTIAVAAPALGRPATLSRVAPVWCPRSEIPLSDCFGVTITGCPGVSDLSGDLKISEPTGEARGTIVLGTGGGGANYYEVAYEPAKIELIERALAAGFRVIQYAWRPPGWLDGPGGPHRLACRYATLINFIHRELARGSAVCASGNSGGSAEIAYALARYDRHTSIDLAVLTGGLPMARLDYACVGPEPWNEQCRALHPCPKGACRFGDFGTMFIDGSYEEGSPCADRDPAKANVWLEDSVMSPSARLEYPNTSVVVISGERDCSESAPLGLLFARATNATTKVVAGADHAVPKSVEGARAIAEALLEGCVKREQSR